jgi:hypothetical protein
LVILDLQIIIELFNYSGNERDDIAWAGLVVSETKKFFALIVKFLVDWQLHKR